MNINVETLEHAIRKFNDWEGGARIYLDLNDGCFETSVYVNDVGMVQTFSDDNFISVFSKEERDETVIEEMERKRIERYADLVLNGWEPIQAEYKLYEEGY